MTNGNLVAQPKKEKSEVFGSVKREFFDALALQKGGGT